MRKLGKYNLNHKKIRIEDFQHPADKRSVEAVLAIPGFSKVIEFISEHALEEQVSMVNQASVLKISPEMSPKLHEMLADAVEMFGCEKTPELFLKRDYTYRIELCGIEKPHVFLPSTWLEAVDDDMLFAVLGAQIAGIQAKQEMMTFLILLLNMLRGVQVLKAEEKQKKTAPRKKDDKPMTDQEYYWKYVHPAGTETIYSRKSILPGGIDQPLTFALRDWERNSIYTADRAILLASESFEVAARHILFGDVPVEMLDKLQLSKPGNAYYRQAREFLQKDLVSDLYQKGKTAFVSAQWTASRYIELYNWYCSGEYYDVLERSIPDEL